jgi:hypothetical protein
MQNPGRFSPVNRVTRTRITMWNAGRGPLEDSKVIHPLGVQFPDGVEVFSVARSDNRTAELEVDLNIEANKVTMVPRYLNQGDEFSVEITHNGKNPSEGVKAIGTVVGAGSVKVQKYRDGEILVIGGLSAGLIGATAIAGTDWANRQPWGLVLGAWIAVVALSIWLTWLFTRRWKRAGRRPQ